MRIKALLSWFLSLVNFVEVSDESSRLLHSNDDEIPSRKLLYRSVDALKLTRYSGREPGRVPEKSKRPIQEEANAVRSREEIPTLEGAQQVDEQDAFPDLHDLTERLTVGTYIIESLVNTERVG